MSLPKILTGQTCESEWRVRREEILRLFEENIYGRMPTDPFEKVKVVKDLHLELASGTVCEKYHFFAGLGLGSWTTVDGVAMRFEVFYKPSKIASAVDGKLPAIVLMDSFDDMIANLIFPDKEKNQEDSFPFEKITDAGYAAVLVHVNDLCPDHATRFVEGIHRIVPRVTDSDWGAIGAWSWGVSRVVDFLFEDARFDGEKVAIVGVSRMGKTSLWCGALDERIAVVISTVSGCGGASIERDKGGERIASMSKMFPHWMCERYATFGDRTEDLPVDQHMLLALMAPRPLYISDAIEDDWACPQNAFCAAVEAGCVYELLGKKPMAVSEFPEKDCPSMEGDVAYHVRSGAHGITAYDWEQYLKFVGKYF